jgi:formylglycine-generating enzyme required for sulfatase activity
VALRRRAAECLGLLAKRSGDRDQRDRIAAALEGWLRSEVLDVRIEVDLDPAVVAEVTNAVDAYVSQLAAAGRLEGMSEELIARSRQDLVAQQLRWLPCDSGTAPGWVEHDALLPLLQGASRGLQLAASAELPLLGSGPGRAVPMLTLTAQEEDAALRIRTEVVEREVWKLPLPSGEQLELVVVEGGEAVIGSPEMETGRDVYANIVGDSCKYANVEAVRTVNLDCFYISRMPVTQGQWQVVKELPRVKHELKNNSPHSWRADTWEQVSSASLPAESISWNQCDEWLCRLNAWLADNWHALGGLGALPKLALSMESQWEVACRAGARSPFHFGDTLDSTWANIHGEYAYGHGRKGKFIGRSTPVGAYGLVNQWGLVDMHGQVAEWCSDFWNPDPFASATEINLEWWEHARRLHGELSGPQGTWKVLRGGSWYTGAANSRAAFRMPFSGSASATTNGMRPILRFA